MQVNYCKFYGVHFEPLSDLNYEVLLENDAGERRRAEHIERVSHGTFSAFGSRTHYSCNIIHFKREADGVDILDGFTRLTFWPQHSPERDHYYTWSLPRGETVSVKRAN